MPCPAILLTVDALHEAAVILDSAGRVLHGNKASEQLFGWHAHAQQGPPSSSSHARKSSSNTSSNRGISAFSVGGVSDVESSSLPPEGGPGTCVSNMLAFPRRSPQNIEQNKNSARNQHVSNGSGAIETSAVMSGPHTGQPHQQPSLNFNPETQQESWDNILASLPLQTICQRDGVGYRLEETPTGPTASAVEPVSFPVSVKFVKMRDDAFHGVGSGSKASDDEPYWYVCAFVKELAHAADQWSRQHNLAIDSRRTSGRLSSKEGRVPIDNLDADTSAVLEDRQHSWGLHEDQLEQRRMLTASNVIEGTIDPMFVINEAGIIIMVNEAAIREFGWSRGDFIGGNISMIVGGGHAKNHNQYIARYLRTGEKRVMGKKRELMARDKQGREFPIELGLTEIILVGGRVTFTGVVRNLSDQKHDKVELRLKHSLTLSIIEASYDAMFYINERGIIQMVNEAAVAQFGWTRNEFLGSNISMICGGGRAPNHDNYIKRYLRTGEKRVMGKKRELRARRRDGSEFPIELGLTEVKVRKGEERSFCGFIRDLSREKEQQMEVMRKQRLTAAIIDAAFHPMFAINSKGIILIANNAAVNQLGWSREEFVGSNISMIVGGGHAKNHDEYIARYLRTGEKRVMGKKRELTARRADGSEFPIELGLTEIKTEENEERLFTGFVRDLTEMKRKEKLTSGIIEASFDPVFAINAKGVINMVNEAAVKQFGWSEEEFVGSNISMIVGGGHAKKHDDYIQRYLKTGEKRVMGVRRELSARKADGSEFPIELGLVEVEVLDGDERKFVGFVRDISSQKKHEVELKEKYSLTEGLIEASLDSMFAIDEQGIIKLVNSAAIDQFGWKREELIGKNIRVIMGPEHSGKHDMYIKRYLRTGEAKILGTQRELEAKRKDGSMFPISLSVSEVAHSGESRMFAAYIHDLSERHRIIEMEKAELLLLNMLPEDIAFRLKASSGHIADHFPNCCILFADLVGFTRMSSKMKPTELVGMLNDVFSVFDTLVDKYDLNKVKTIGDCYMVTSHPDEDTELEEISHVCHFALDMIDSLISYNIEHPGKNLQLRIGLNVGPVVAGVVGKKRFLYDLWGDSVNLASRMESTGLPGKIHCTKAIVDLVESEFDFESRGEVDVKGVGMMETFLLTQRKRMLDGKPTSTTRAVKTRRRRRRSLLMMESLQTLKSSRRLLDEQIDSIQNRMEDVSIGSDSADTKTAQQ